MIKILLFLASLEQKVSKGDSGSNKEGTDWTVNEYKGIKKSKESLEKKMPSYPTLGERVKTAFTNTKNIVRNAYDNSIGYVIAKNQNRQTTNHYKKNPADQKSIVYLMHGVAQNEGSQWRLGKELKKEGYTPYHLKGHHNLPRKENADKAFNQIEYLHKKTSLKEPQSRKDYFSGHSSGAEVGIYMAGDKRIAKYGIKQVQARAPVPYGFEPKTSSQKVLGTIMDLKYDNIKNKEARESAIEMDRRKPVVPVYVVSGKNDDLVPPKDAVYKSAKKHYVINHKNSTHFGTSGGNSDMNKIFVEMLKEQNQAKYTPEKHYKHI